MREYPIGAVIELPVRVHVTLLLPMNVPVLGKDLHALDARSIVVCSKSKEALRPVRRVVGCQGRDQRRIARAPVGGSGQTT